MPILAWRWWLSGCLAGWANPSRLPVSISAILDPIRLELELDPPSQNRSKSSPQDQGCHVLSCPMVRRLQPRYYLNGICWRAKTAEAHHTDGVLASRNASTCMHGMADYPICASFSHLLFCIAGRLRHDDVRVRVLSFPFPFSPPNPR